jgi:hypothetical protein
MSENRKTTGTDRLPFTGLGCPKCGYNLSGTTKPRCPECGGVFDPKQLRPCRDRLRPRWRVVILTVLLVVYLPNTWVFWIDYPWNSYRMTWVKMFPLLPSLYPGAWLAHLTGLRKAYDDVGMFVIAGCITVVLIVGGVLLGRRSWKWLIPVCIVLLAFEVFNAYVCYALFRM